jgi:hypothetical protein
MTETSHGDPTAKAQAQLDHWWQSRRDLEAELADVYEVGGFLERHSRSVGFHKSKRDPDWSF